MLRNDSYKVYYPLSNTKNCKTDLPLPLASPAECGSKPCLLLPPDLTQLSCRGRVPFVPLQIFNGICSRKTCLQRPQDKLGLCLNTCIFLMPKSWVYIFVCNLDSELVAAVRWVFFWNQSSFWGKGAGKKVCEALDQPQVRDAEEAILSWAEGLLNRCGQGADKREKVFRCEKLKQAVTSFRQELVNANLR